MANAKTYSIDPNIFQPTSLSGVAQSPADRNASAWTRLLLTSNLALSAGFELLDTTATTLSLDVFESRLNVSGTMAFTLPDGTVIGQRKRVRCVAAASTPLATLTVTTPETATNYACSSTFVFDTIGQAVEFEWTENSKWKATTVTRAGGTANNVVVGTTVLTGLNLWATYFLSVTGTVSSTTTKGVPNGSAIGEQILVGCSTAASTPSGTISITGVTNAGGAATTLGTCTATTHFATLRWNGAAWQVLGNATLVLS